MSSLDSHQRSSGGGMVGRLAHRAVAAISALSFSIVVATAAPVAAATSNVSISSMQCAGGKLFCYKPSSLTVTNGNGVKWTDTTGVQHTVTRCTVAACGSPGPGSGTDSTFTSATIAPNG